MRDTSQQFVTIAVAQDSVEANIIKNYLNDAGVQAFVADDEAISMDWLMANAIGGIKVQVAAVDADEAREALDLRSEAGEHGEVWTSTSPSASLERMTVDEEPETPVSDRAINANRAFRAAVFGLLFWPIELYAAYVLFKVYRSRETLAGRPRTLAKMALLIVATAIVAPVLVSLVFLRSPAQPEIDLRALPHPAILVGTWQDKNLLAGASVRISMRLHENGEIHYSERGGSPVECEGTWGFTDYSFLVRYDRYLKGDRPYKGKLLRYELKDFRGNEMSMRFGEEWVRLVRTK
jgi:hypothetical protein